MMTLKRLVRSSRSYLTVLAIWIGLAALMVGSSFYMRWIPLMIGAIFVLFSAGLALWAIIAFVDHWRGRAYRHDTAVSPGRRVGEQVFGSAIALWIVITAFYCFSAFIDDGTMFLIALAAPPVFVFWIAVVIWCLVLTVKGLKRREYRRALRVALLPMLATGSILYGQDIGDLARFEIERPSYVTRIAAARAGVRDERIEVDIGPPMIAFLPWGGFLSNFNGVVFDETDAITKPVTARLETWRDRAIPGELRCAGDVMSVGGHFYVGRFAC